MPNDDLSNKIDNTTDDIDISKRELFKSAAWLVLTASLGAGYSKVAAASESYTTPPWGATSALVSAIGSCTLAVANLADSVEAYKQGFGYVEHWHGPIPEEMATFWGVPGMVGRKAAVVGPVGFERGMIRIVELGSDFQRTSYGSTLGWGMLEIQVRSTEELVAGLKGSQYFVHVGGPSTANGRDGKPIYRAAQFTGPSGELLAMTQHLQLDQLSSVGSHNVGPLFMQILGAYPYQTTRDFYMDTLGMEKIMESDIARTNLVEELGVPKGRTYKTIYGRTPEYCTLQVDEYPDATPQRSATPGCFAAGVSICTLTARNLDAVKAALRKADVQFAEIESNSIPPFIGSRGIFCLGKTGERVEIVEVEKK
ncbi:MAG: hypothetical protein ABI128_00120 [Rhodanobacter sp.]